VVFFAWLVSFCAPLLPCCTGKTLPAHGAPPVTLCLLVCNRSHIAMFGGVPPLAAPAQRSFASKRSNINKLNKRAYHQHMGVNRVSADGKALAWTGSVLNAILERNLPACGLSSSPGIYRLRGCGILTRGDGRPVAQADGSSSVAVAPPSGAAPCCNNMFASLLAHLPRGSALLALFIHHSSMLLHALFGAASSAARLGGLVTFSLSPRVAPNGRELCIWHGWAGTDIAGERASTRQADGMARL